MKMPPKSPLLVLGILACAPADPEDAAPRSLQELLACNDVAMGGDALRSFARVEYDLDIREPTFEVEGTYVATRDGTARIDIYAEGERVFSEGWDGKSGWQQGRGASEPVPTSAEAGAPLRHGLEQPGHLWTLRDMEAHGHSVALADEIGATVSGAAVVHLTLKDGFESWYWLDPSTCLATRKRDFRAFHPDVDPDETWIETHYGDYRRTAGVTRAWESINIDAATGDTIGMTRLRAVRFAARAN